MRTFLLLFVILLSLNSAYAVSAGVRDALEDASSQVTHFGHHSHEQGDEHVHVHVHDAAVDAGEAGDVLAVKHHHHHDHGHSSFLCIMSDAAVVMPFEGCSPLVATPGSTFISAPQSLLDRPPRAALV